MNIIEEAKKEPKCEQLLKEYEEAIEKKETNKVKIIELIIKNKLKTIFNW